MYYYQHLTMILMYLYSFFHSVDLRRSSRRSKARFRPVPLGLQRRCGREALEPLEPEKIRAEVRWEVRFSQNSRVTWQDIRHDKAVQFDVLLMWIYIYIYIWTLWKGDFVRYGTSQPWRGRSYWESQSCFPTGFEWCCGSSPPWSGWHAGEKCIILTCFSTPTKNPLW